ncbi:histidine phosphatase family protein [Halovenus carboxidivorans]|uniref:histidine phosphatase family protein n=1 Tax=Halovenus carboxidivorans TaxID=2692199 RepID=UPI0034A1B1CE
MTAETVLLVRHGETDWNREGRLQGWAPTPLNERGREQARRLGVELAETYDIDRVVASDSLRTRETTAGIRDAAIDPEPEFDSAWRERGLGVWQGFTWGELESRFPAFEYDNGLLALEERPEGGETLVDMYERVLGAWTDLQSASAETTLVVTHGGPITVVLARLNDLDIPAAIRRYSINNCAVTEIDLARDETVRENELLFEPVPPREP